MKLKSFLTGLLLCGALLAVSSPALASQEQELLYEKIGSDKRYERVLKSAYRLHFANTSARLVDMRAFRDDLIGVMVYKGGFLETWVFEANQVERGPVLTKGEVLHASRRGEIFNRTIPMREVMERLNMAPSKLQNWSAKEIRSVEEMTIEEIYAKIRHDAEMYEARLKLARGLPLV